MKTCLLRLLLRIRRMIRRNHYETELYSILLLLFSQIITYIFFSSSLLYEILFSHWANTSLVSLNRFIGTPFRRNGCQIRNSVKTVPYIKIFAQTMPSRASFRNMHRSQHLYTPFVGENSSNTCLFFANVLFAFPPELDTVEIVPKAAAHIFQSWHTSEALLQKKYMWQCKLPAVGGLPTMYGSMG